MTNGEFYKEILKKIADNERGIAIYNEKPKACNYSCYECERSYDTYCSDSKLLEWYNSEYIPPKPKLTKRQKAFCECVETGWLARQSSEYLVLFNKKPRYDGEDYSRARNDEKSVFYLTGGNFPDFTFITNDKPISIKEMLTWEVEE